MQNTPFSDFPAQLTTLLHKHIDVPTVHTLPTLGRHSGNKDMAIQLSNPNPALSPTPYALIAPVYEGERGETEEMGPVGT